MSLFFIFANIGGVIEILIVVSTFMIGGTQ